MFNALRYIRKLEEVGFPREQAEAQLQIVIDVIEGELVNKDDFKNLQNEMASLRSELKNDMANLRAESKNDLFNFKQEVAHQFTNLEYRIVTKIGVLVVTTVTLAVAFSTWLIKLK